MKTESHTLEFKESVSEWREIAETIAAFNCSEYINLCSISKSQALRDIEQLSQTNIFRRIGKSSATK